jgi:hypothetical protein
MNWASVLIDIVGGLLIAGVLAAWVPDSFWRHLFFASHPLAAKIWGPLIGPAISVVAFVCSIGNVPLAAVLWNGGISFGGVVSFIFADLIIIPILVIYRKYYGTRMALRLFTIFYATMTAAGYIIEFIFGPLGLVPSTRNATPLNPHISWNSDTYLDIVAIAVTVLLLVRFFRSGGRPMLAMMGGSPDGGDDGGRMDMTGTDMTDMGHRAGAYDPALGQPRRSTGGLRDRPAARGSAARTSASGGGCPSRLASTPARAPMGAPEASRTGAARDRSACRYVFPPIPTRRCSQLPKRR